MKGDNNAFTAYAGRNDIDQYGNVVLNVKCVELLAAGFWFGDVINVSFLDQSIDVPFCYSYSDVNAFENCIYAKSYIGYMILMTNSESFAQKYKLWERYNDVNDIGLTDYCEDAKKPIEFVLSLKRKKCCDSLEHQLLVYSISRTHYYDLNDMEYANFRMVNTSGIRSNILFRSSSPINPVMRRNTYADNAMRLFGVNCIMNLSDSFETAKRYVGFDHSYYSTANVIYLNMDMDIGGRNFKESMCRGFRFFAQNKGIYGIHCKEGKDRTGLVVAILECLLGADYDEIVEDYMISFRNLYDIDPKSNEYNVLADGSIGRMLRSAFEVESLDECNLLLCAEKYVKDAGLSDDEIETLRVNIGTI